MTGSLIVRWTTEEGRKAAVWAAAYAMRELEGEAVPEGAYRGPILRQRFGTQDIFWILYRTPAGTVIMRELK